MEFVNQGSKFPETMRCCHDKNKLKYFDKNMLKSFKFLCHMWNSNYFSIKPAEDEVDHKQHLSRNFI